MRRLWSTDDYSAVGLNLTLRSHLAANKGRCRSNSLFAGFALPVAAKCSVGLHGALFAFSLKLKKTSPIKKYCE